MREWPWNKPGVTAADFRATLKAQEESTRKARASVRTGAGGEDIVLTRLQLLGCIQVRKIEVGWKITRIAGKIVGAHPIEGVAGDYRAVLPGGRSVLCEGKTRLKEHLAYSDLEDHQVANLNEHHAAGGLSLLAYVFPGGCSIMTWPVPHFLPRRSLSPDHARLFNLTQLPKG